MVERRPAARTSLIGREREVAALRELLARSSTRLVTLTGVGGGGKTRLAMAIAAEVPDAFDGAIHWVVLAPVADTALVPQAVASALGVIETAGTPLIEAVATRLAAERCLLVLDNCEHLLDACAELVEHLLAACPDLRILATSREPLTVAGEQQWRVPPLPVPDSSEPASLDSIVRSPSVRLFVERAQAVVPEFRLTPANAEAVADVCVRLDGIPLALELAAARVRVLSVEQIRTRLDDAFRLLTGGSRAAPTRQQTLLATLDWSYDLLTDSERALFRRIAVFAGSFDIEAVETVCEGVEALDLVTRLVDKSLLTVETDGQVARYRLLEPVRQYADQHLSASGEGDDARAQHVTCYLALAERAAPELRGPAQVAWMARLRHDQDNLRAALRWADERGDVETVARLAVALVPFWAVHGAMGEGRRWLEVALTDDHPRPLPPALRVPAFLGAGQLAYWQLDLERAAAQFETGLALARGMGDRHAIADALTGLGTVRGREMAFDEATRLLRESLSLHRALGDEAGAAWALFHLGMAAGNQDDWRSSVELLEESLERYRALGNVRFVAMTCMNLGAALIGLGKFERATGLIREGLTELRAVGERAFMLSGLLTLAWVAVRAEQPARAARLLGAAAALRATTGAIMGPVNRRTHDMVFDMVRAQLGQTDLDDALALGRAMSLDEAIEEAMNLGQPEPSVSVASVPPPGGPVEALTRREREIIPLLAHGATDREIAETLTIAVSTVGVHVHHILGKLGLNSRWQVADWAVANGLLPTPSD